jgi:hypothetical protein
MYDMGGLKICVVNVKYKNAWFNEVLRKRQLNEIDFLSFVGGLLGLFAGFSTLSFIEVVYWLSVRILTRTCSRNSTAVHPMTVSGVAAITKSRSFIKFIRDFFDNSSVHGLSYFTSRNVIER